MSSASRNVELVTILNLFRLDMMEIKGKRGRKVPIILTEEMKDSIGLLIKTRKAVGIPDANTYVFARAGGSLLITFEDGLPQTICT